MCSNVIKLKVYGGYVNKNPFVFTCPKCEVTISGHLNWNEDPKEGFVKEFVCRNGDICEEHENISHLLQLATEFFTDKIKPYKYLSTSDMLSPFMIGSESFDIKMQKRDFVVYIMEHLEKDFNNTLKIWELYKKNQKVYLNRELLKYEFVKPVILGEVLKINYNKVIPEVLKKPFMPFVNVSRYNLKLYSLNNTLKEIKEKSMNELFSLKADLGNLIENIEYDLVHLLKNFSDYYKNIWPIILSDLFGGADINNIKNKKGILTTDFSSLKNYYVEAFEILTSFLPVLLGLQNIFYRGNRNLFEKNIQNDFNKINSIIDYRDKVVNKGNKIKYFEKENLFLKCYDISKVLDNFIRNSIGHHSYEYESDKQLILFEDRNKQNDMYLIEFANLLLQTFYATVTSLEVLTFLNSLD